MTNESLISRAEILINQNRYEEAGKVLADAWVNEPDNTYVLALYAEVKLTLNEIREAEDLINNAIAISPEADYLYYIRSRIALKKEKYDEAEQYLGEAISLDPQNADYHALWASIKLARKKYQEALNAADEALSLDSENILALNTRSTALLKLNRKEESFFTIRGALNENPDDAYTHSNYGWNLLEQGEQEQALTHFREALRNDPDNTYAQQGMAEALKAKYVLYRWFLKYSFWIGNLASKYQWLVLFAFFFGTKILRGIAESSSTLKPVLQPLVVLLMLIAFSTWVIGPISNLFLRFNKYGMHLLDRKEKLSSNFVAVSFGVFILGLLCYALGGERWLPLSVFGFVMMLPLSVMLTSSKSKGLLIGLTAMMAVVGILAIAESLSTGEVVNGYSSIFIVAFVAFQFLANFLIIRQTNR